MAVNLICILLQSPSGEANIDNEIGPVWGRSSHPTAEAINEGSKQLEPRGEDFFFREKEDKA